MRVLVIGSGGREHAIIWALKNSSERKLDLYCAPGNAGISLLAQSIAVPVTDHYALIQFVASHGIDLTVVGPEAPLARGIVDDFERKGLAIVGPAQAAARLESSKAFAKDFMARHGIPTASYRIATSASDALDLLKTGEFGSFESPCVIKADGLAAGKGVVVATSRADAATAITELTSGKLVDKHAASRIVLEQALRGTEASVLLFSDGRDYVLMPAARDHKRIGENDTGPNTGGMGAITDPAVLDEQTLEQIRREIIEPTLNGARDEGFTFRGVLFIGLMLTNDGPKVLEYNVRFGDPETQAILVRLKTDLLSIFEAMRTGSLTNTKVKWSAESSACVVLASRGYPGASEVGVPIHGLERLEMQSRVKIFHASTSRSATGEFVTAGGRVLGVTSAGRDLSDALTECYGAIDQISWEGMQFRHDIGKLSRGN
jgi:phosphoribosylamine--glycine ligase